MAFVEIADLPRPDAGGNCPPGLVRRRPPSWQDGTVIPDECVTPKPDDGKQCFYYNPCGAAAACSGQGAGVPGVMVGGACSVQQKDGAIPAALIAKILEQAAVTGGGYVAQQPEAVCGPKSQMLLDRSHSWTCCPNRKTWVLHHFTDKDPCGLKPPECAPGTTRNQITGECLRSNVRCGNEPSSFGVVESAQHRAWRECMRQDPSPVGPKKVAPATIAVGAAVVASLGLALWITLKD